ncbi:hypothetical protein LR48_Vigan06g087300 [Vigna angularis]|uniref:RRM domain-containing protein n=2 Tax=Phaseolus angularis TaxID=3914 RepID=A0A0L9USL8_PHAAN|nr:uncharacterized protein LOC108335151 [Vigna angularis]KOM45567.1 hypothetical protein LR48_Vigan06g087300 [Vigna angularis]BAT99587.1 hypothetical protein VIGAN_10104500 [Vigna angularis var. angularis]
MLRSTAFPTPYNSVPLLSHAHTCYSLAPSRAASFHFSFVSKFVCLQFRQPCSKLSGRAFVAVSAKKKRPGGSEIAVADDGLDEEEYDNDLSDEFDDEEEEFDYDDDDEGMLPLEKMNKWFEKRPKGFGEGKVYDTSVEDKLLEEIRQSRVAQVENLKMLKSNPVKHASNEKDDKKKDTKLVPIGSRVRLVNLPKKKNILRDLKAALQGIPGITNIAPAVIGNKKTRDPICKGFAFVDFKREEDAVRFVELYTGQTITFGKIQKQIKCELLNGQSLSPSLKISENLSAAPQHMDTTTFEEDSDEDSNSDDDSALSTWDETNSDDLDGLDNLMDGEEQEDDGGIQESVTALRVDGDDGTELRIHPETNSPPSDKLDRNSTVEKKSFSKVKQENARTKKSTSKEKAKTFLDIPGSSRRLKIREKAVLSDVFSKYGSKATLASKDS